MWEEFPWKTFVFNRSSGPHGILNWVISKVVSVKLHVWYWNFEQLTSSKLSPMGSWSSGGWLIELTSQASLSSLSSLSSYFSGSTSIVFCVKSELSFCCCLTMKWKQTNNINKWSVIDRQSNEVEIYAPVSPGIVWNAWHKNNL